MCSRIPMPSGGTPPNSRRAGRLRLHHGRLPRCLRGNRGPQLLQFRRAHREHDGRAVLRPDIRRLLRYRKIRPMRKRSECWARGASRFRTHQLPPEIPWPRSRCSGCTLTPIRGAIARRRSRPGIARRTSREVWIVCRDLWDCGGTPLASPYPDRELLEAMNWLTVSTTLRQLLLLRVRPCLSWPPTKRFRRIFHRHWPKPFLNCRRYSKKRPSQWSVLDSPASPRSPIPMNWRGACVSSHQKPGIRGGLSRQKKRLTIVFTFASLLNSKIASRQFALAPNVLTAVSCAGRDRRAVFRRWNCRSSKRGVRA